MLKEIFKHPVVIPLALAFLVINCFVLEYGGTNARSRNAALHAMSHHPATQRTSLAKASAKFHRPSKTTESNPAGIDLRVAYSGDHRLGNHPLQDPKHTGEGVNMQLSLRMA